VPAGGGLPESLHAAFLRLCSVLRFFFVGSCHHKPRGASISMPASAAAPALATSLLLLALSPSSSLIGCSYSHLAV
jgi:hypothetical protein